MNILKSIYKNELDINDISLSKAIFIVFIFVLASNLICSIFMSTILFLYPNITFAIISYIFVLVLVDINMIIFVGKKNVRKDKIKTKNIESKKNHNTIFNDYLYVFFIVVGYILIREVFLFEILSKFEGPISQDDISFIIENLKPIEIIIFCMLIYIQSTIFAPIFEEILFRGIILNGMLSKYKNNQGRAVLYSAIIFGVVHLNIPQGINAMMVGLILGFIYYSTKNIKLCIFVHFINNLFTFIPTPEDTLVKLIYLLLGLCMIVKGVKQIKK